MNTQDNYALAQELVALGYIPVAMQQGTKIPAESAWQEWPLREITEESIAQRWKGTRNGISILCHNVVVLDVDQADLLDFVLKQTKLESAPICRTPRGGYHVHARARKGMQLSRKIRVRNRCIDLLTGASLSILPPHETVDGAYEWISGELPPAGKLPLANLAWTRERRKKRAKSVLLAAEEPSEGDEILYRGRLYVDTFDRRAVDGQNGHTSLFVAALKIVSFVRRLGGGEEQMWQLLLYFNATKCDPPWDPSDPRDLAALQHKLSDALKK